MNIRPLGDRVLVEPDPAEETTAGGLELPESVRKKPHYGTVVAAGPGAPGRDMTVKAGDRVHFSKYAGVEFQHEGKALMYIRQDDIFSTI